MPKDGGGGGRGSRAASPFVLKSVPGEGGAGPDVRVSVLDNGLRVLTERVSGVRSIAAGVWIVQGVAHEPPELLGVSHMLEHMVFKGTERLSQREIALSLEALGGSLDAYTSREHTSYQARVLDRYLPEALDVLAELTMRPLLREADLELEREVVLEEIATVEDTPDDLVFELHAEALWGEHGYGRPILGTRETVSALNADDLAAVHRRAYRARNMVVAVVGNLDHDVVLEEIAARFSPLAEGEEAGVVASPSPVGKGTRRVERESAQAHIVFGTPTFPHADPRRHTLALVSHALGGGMSSRLFQRIREELALAYSVYSFHAFYRAAGAAGVYLGTRPGMAEHAVEAVREELARLSSEGLSPDELELVKGQVKGQLTLALESTGARLHKLAGFALHGDPVVSLGELLARYDRVEVAQVCEVARRHFHPDEHLVMTLGP